MTKKLFSTLKFVAFLLLLLISHVAFSQTDLSNVRVDDLSDKQIRELITRAASIGYTTDSQIVQLAEAQGMSESEGQRLALRLVKIKRENNDGIATGGNDNSGRNGNLLGDGKTGDPSAGEGGTIIENKNTSPQKDPLGNLVLSVFGEDLFKSSGRSTFEPNLRIATPKSYVIGPDDQLIIDLTGDNEANYRPKVTPDGSINIQYIGIISVGGLTIEQATSKLKAAFAKTYPGVRTGKTSVAVTLGNIRSIKVTIVGEANRPGSYTLSSLSTVFNALYESGGPNKNGSLRTIQVIRNNKIVSVIDVYDFLLKGLQKNIRLQDQDVINIPVFKTRIEMNGEFKRPALYEIIGSESLQDAITFAGGFTSLAYTAGLKILQNTDRERRITDISSANYSSYKPTNGDKVIAEQILDRFENRVEITGAVFRPGKFALDKGLTLKQLIAKADGLKEDAFLNRGYINRINGDNTASLLSFDLKKLMSGAEPDIQLQREDIITISSIFSLRDEYTVFIQGDVRAPGSFKFQEGLSLESLIQQAGGFKEGATPDRVEIARRITNSNAMSKSSEVAQIFTVSVNKDLKLTGPQFLLQPFDIISIRTAEGFQVQKTIVIQGEVLYPGPYSVKTNNEKISDIIKRAGGLTAVAFPAGASLTRVAKVPTGSGGARNINTDKNETEKLGNLKRLQTAQGESSAEVAADEVNLRSDFVGIDLVKILKDSTWRDNLLVENGDVITIPRVLQTVSVTGEVLKPINIVYKPGKSMGEYISESGGFTYRANKRGAYVVYANGAIKATKKLLFFYSYPAVKPGAEIFVPKTPVKVPIGLTGLVGISTALASLAVIVITLFRK